MPQIQFSANAVTTMLNELATLLNGGKLRLYDGVDPESASDPLSGNTLLAELSFGNPAFASPVPYDGGVEMTANPLTSTPANNANGTATFFRATASNGTVLFQGLVGLTDAELTMDTTTVTTGTEVQITTIVIGIATPYEAVPFSPETISGKALWLDAADTSSISIVNSNANQWLDKSGNNRHVTASSSTKRPAVTVDPMNLSQILKFSGSNSLQCSQFWAGLGDCSIFIVMRGAGRTNVSRLISESSTASTTPLYSIGTSSNNLRISWRADDNVLSQSASGAPLLDGGVKVISVLDTTTQTSSYVRGTESTGYTYTRGASTPTTFSVGSLFQATDSSFFAGDLSEIMILDRVVGAQERLDIEQYLLDKWLGSTTEQVDFVLLLGDAFADGTVSLGSIPSALSTFYSGSPNDGKIFHKPAYVSVTTLDTTSFVNNGEWWRLGTTYSTSQRRTHQTLQGDDHISGTGNVYGPELELNYQWSQNKPGRKLCIIKAAVRGSQLGAHWGIDSPGTTSLWYWLKTYAYGPAYASLLSYNKAPQFKAVIWAHGTSDATNSTQAAGYQARLQTLINRCNTEFFTPPEKIIIVGLNASYTDANAVTFKNAQAAVAANVANTNTVLIRTDGSGDGAAIGLSGSDFSASGLTTLAQRIYQRIYP
jgi:carbohydrate esterase-like sialic acid-specific acetylesterase